MKVVQINATYGQKSTGTIVRDIEMLCHSSNIECYIASPGKEVLKARNGYRIGNIIDHKVHAVLCRVNGMQAYFSTLSTVCFLRYLDKIKPDIVHLHNLHSNYLNLNLLLKYLAKHDIATIVTLHDCWFFTGGCSHYTSVGCYEWMNKCGKCPSNAAVVSSIFKYRSDKVIEDKKKYLSAIPRLYVVGVSDWITNEWRKANIPCKQAITIHNGVDVNTFSPVTSNLKHQLGVENKYVMLGPAIKWLLPINKDVLDYFSNHMKSDEVLILFGVDDTKQKVSDNIMLIGYVKSPSELSKLYSCADVFVNTTREDSFSLINIEAQACGTPVVTFDQTGPKETVDEINSVSVHVGDSVRLYQMATAVKGIERYKLNCDCRSFVCLNFNQQVNFLEYINLYNSI